jgi:hypothetical protein
LRASRGSGVRPAANRALSGGKRGSSQPPGEGIRSALQADAEANPEIAEKARKLAERALDRESRPTPTERPSEHAKSFPPYFVAKILDGEVPMPPEGAPNRELIEGWIAAEVDHALNPFTSRDRTWILLPRPIARSLDHAGVAPESIEDRLDEIVSTRESASAPAPDLSR